MGTAISATSFSLLPMGLLESAASLEALYVTLPEGSDFGSTIRYFQEALDRGDLTGAKALRGLIDEQLKSLPERFSQFAPLEVIVFHARQTLRSGALQKNQQEVGYALAPANKDDKPEAPLPIEKMPEPATPTRPRVQVIDRSDRPVSEAELLRVLIERGLDVGKMMREIVAEWRRTPVSMEGMDRLAREIAQAAALAKIKTTRVPDEMLMVMFEQPLIQDPPLEIVPYCVSSSRDLVRSTGLHQGLILEWKAFPDLLRNGRVVNFQYGWPEVTIQAKGLSPQDYFEFCQIILFQAKHFIAWMHLIQIRGGDIHELEPTAKEIQETLADGLDALLRQEFEKAKIHLDKTDHATRHFRNLLMREGRKVGIRFHPLGFIFAVEE